MEYSQKDAARAVIIAITLTSVFTVLVVWSWTTAAKKNGTLVIPAGNTYLGSNPPRPKVDQPPTGSPPGGAKQPTLSPVVFTVSPDVRWNDIRGTVYPYVMSVPATLTLVTPAGNNPYDLYEITWGGFDPASNVLIGVDNLKDHPDRVTYISQPKIEYVRNWWRQFGGLKGVTSIDPFTNSNGLRGYKAKYTNSAGDSPNLDVFFEVPGRRELIIHLANGILDPAVFDKIVDSVNWKP